MVRMRGGTARVRPTERAGVLGGLSLPSCAHVRSPTLPCCAAVSLSCCRVHMCMTLASGYASMHAAQAVVSSRAGGGQRHVLCGRVRAADADTLLPHCATRR